MRQIMKIQIRAMSTGLQRRQIQYESVLVHLKDSLKNDSFMNHHHSESLKNTRKSASYWDALIKTELLGVIKTQRQ